MGGTGLRTRVSGVVALLPYYDQSAVANIVSALAAGGSSQPPWNATAPWTQTFPTMTCPSDPGAVPPVGALRGKRNYVFCAGDGAAGNGDGNTSATPVIVRTRGMFAALACYGIRDCTDGTSNTIAMAEAIAPTDVNGQGAVAATTGISNPAACTALYNKQTRNYPAGGYSGDTTRGYRWGDGGAYFSAFSTATPPNSASCFTGGASHWHLGMYNTGSLHVGGTHCLMTDGAVRFISENIDAGNQATAVPAPNSSGRSPYGVWGALGSRGSGEVVGEF